MVTSERTTRTSTVLVVSTHAKSREHHFVITTAPHQPRFNSFHTADAWKDSVKKQKPDRMEIGPVYSQEPKLKDGLHKDHFFPVGRELIFDIDMDDYDEVRTCCSGATVCGKCWQ